MKALFGADNQSSWWDAPLEMGPAPFTRSTRRRGMCSSGPSRRLNVALRWRSGIRCVPASMRYRVVRARSVAFETVSSVMSLGVSSDELGELLRAYVGDIPVSAVRAIGDQQDLACVVACSRWA